MYTVDNYSNMWLIKNSMMQSFVVGPFESESDAGMVAEWLNYGKMMFAGDSDGQENFKE